MKKCSKSSPLGRRGGDQVFFIEIAIAKSAGGEKPSAFLFYASTTAKPGLPGHAALTFFCAS
jgi:hypothetical protein